MCLLSPFFNRTAQHVAVQVSRSGRIRVPPLAFWANQRLCRDAYAIDNGFSDQIAQACQSFTQQSPVSKEPSSKKGAAHKAQAKTNQASKPKYTSKASSTPALVLGCMNDRKDDQHELLLNWS
jgi:CRISPR/Cas system Type II protein with McrA/HNH and RuvC-like nuclease domain